MKKLIAVLAVTSTFLLNSTAQASAKDETCYANNNILAAWTSGAGVGYMASVGSALTPAFPIFAGFVLATAVFDNNAGGICNEQAELTKDEFFSQFSKIQVNLSEGQVIEVTDDLQTYLVQALKHDKNRLALTSVKSIHFYAKGDGLASDFDVTDKELMQAFVDARLEQITRGDTR